VKRRRGHIEERPPAPEAPGPASLPSPDPDPEWRLALDGLDPEVERARETCLTLADGLIGTSGSPLLAHPAATPSVLAAGVYDGVGPETDLLPGPRWTLLEGALRGGDTLRRELDLRRGLLLHDIGSEARRARAVVFSSLARPGTTVLRAEGDPELLDHAATLVPPEGRSLAEGEEADAAWIAVRGTHGGIAAAAMQATEAGAGAGRLERVAAFVVNRSGAADPEEALARLRTARGIGFDRLLDEHTEAWAQRWETADIRIVGDPDLQRAVRFNLFHLIGSVADRGEAAVGARGLAGDAYRGHVFWDADVFVLPFLAATHAPAARAMLEYRVRRLPAAREIARRLGREGARFPWESAADGFDVTPPSARDATGKLIPIRTGILEEHVVADVAWAATTYVDWTGDRDFEDGPGRELLCETARYWASRIRLDPQGRGHIYGVIGPDEYHEPVDDNAFTNVMARWNLRRAAAVDGVDADEARRWLDLADALVDGHDADTGVYEQFSGFFGLEPLVIADVAPRRPIAADMLLGRDRVRGSQVVKQADVLMLYHLVPEEVAPGLLAPNLDFYEPRTSHGSSLSPAIHASLLARQGRLQAAVDYLRITAKLDLDDLTGTTAGGLHIAAMGGVWQALVQGFAGIRPHGNHLTVDPRLPEGWEALEVPVTFRGARVRIRIEPGRVCVRADAPVTILFRSEPPITIQPGTLWEAKEPGP
jgi:trehalose/maltose hydrolase-like predicted phosphorylase